MSRIEIRYLEAIGWLWQTGRIDFDQADRYRQLVKAGRYNHLPDPVYNAAQNCRRVKDPL